MMRLAVIALAAVQPFCPRSNGGAPAPARRRRVPARMHLTSYRGCASNATAAALEPYGASHPDDWDTTRMSRSRTVERRTPAAAFLMEGKPFQAADWARLEEGPGRLRAGMRAAAWVCDDGGIRSWTGVRRRALSPRYY